MASLHPPAQQTPTAPRFAAKLMAIMDELAKVFAEEMPLLEKRDYSRQAEMTRRKDQLMMVYQAALKDLRDHESIRGSLTEQERLALRKAGAALDDMAEQNADMLRRAHASTERLLHVVMDEVRREIHRESGYSVRGHLVAAESAYSRPVAYNQRV